MKIKGEILGQGVRANEKAAHVGRLAQIAFRSQGGGGRTRWRHHVGWWQGRGWQSARQRLGAGHHGGDLQANRGSGILRHLHGVLFASVFIQDVVRNRAVFIKGLAGARLDLADFWGRIALDFVAQNRTAKNITVRRHVGSATC